MGGGGVKNCPKLRDVIYGRPLSHKFDLLYTKVMVFYNDSILNIRICSNCSRISSDLVSDNIRQYFPHFVWALRDFYLKLNIDGVELTPGNLSCWQN